MIWRKFSSCYDQTQLIKRELPTSALHMIKQQFITNNIEEWITDIFFFTFVGSLLGDIYKSL